jgi:hypothetical protein
MMYATEIASGGTSFIKFVTGFQVIFRFYLRNVRGCNVGIIDGPHL